MMGIKLMKIGMVFNIFSKRRTENKSQANFACDLFMI